MLAGERIADKELKIQTDAGGFSTLLVSGSPRLDFDGKVAGAIFIGQDIFARVAGEQRIKAQARALVKVQDIERLRISRGLHDEVAQDLSFAVRIACETLFDGVDGNESSLCQRVARLKEAIASSLQAIHGIAYDMRPLDAAGKRLASEHAANISCIVQESLANAWRHWGTRVTCGPQGHQHRARAALFPRAGGAADDRRRNSLS